MTEAATYAGGYAELHCHSWFSLLDGASSPEALVARAKEIGLAALAITDHDSLAGVVRFWTAAQRAGMHAVIGAEVTIEGDHHLTLLAETQGGYANLCTLLTQVHCGPVLDGEPWPGKTITPLTWEALTEHHAGLIALSGCRRGLVAAPLLNREVDKAKAAAARLCDVFGREHTFIELQHHRAPGDAQLVRGLISLAREMNLPMVATHNAHYATARASRLRDALIAIDHLETLNDARTAGHLPFNNAYGLASPAEMAHIFGNVPEALRNTLAIAERCDVAIDFSNQRLPTFPTPPGLTEFTYLAQLCHQALPRRYPNYTPAVLNQLTHELTVIEQTGLAGYFLVVWDLVRFAGERGIRCQGRGSAAGSVVAYVLGISAVDPIEHRLLFERFLSADRHTAPDVDIDFASDRREEVIQYVYDRYGLDHVAMACNHVTYQARSAIRDLGKVLDLLPMDIDRLAKASDAHSCTDAARAIETRMEAKAEDGHVLRLLAELLRMIDGCPRHLSIHVGGLIITGPPLCEVVPLERAAMARRVVCQWDKNSIEDAGLIKIDVLSLRTLALVTEAITLAGSPDLPTRLDDPAIYDMLCRADTIGAFQVESRAQQQMLPRMKPNRLADITVAVAIVRPGPIQAGATHPYFRRRAGEELVAYLHPCLQPVLEETLGVMLYQEQAIKVAMAAADFTPGEADALRRSLARNHVDDATLRRFIHGAMQKGMTLETATAVFAQLSGFAGFGFCKSHASSFALIAYQTLWLKRYHPRPFYCALLNNQPMGFYSAEVVIGDAKRHGVGLLPPDVHRSAWKYTLEDGALRMGAMTISGIGEAAWTRVEEARASAPFASLADFCRRTRLPAGTVSDLIRAGALDGFGERRDLLWELGEVDYRPEALAMAALVSDVDLPALEALERTGWEYELLGLSPDGHLLRHYRLELKRAGILSTVEAKAQRDGRFVRLAGMLVVRQQPSTAKGIVFLSLEDEHGLADGVVKPEVYARFRDVLRSERLLILSGVVQRGAGHGDGVSSVLVSKVEAFG